MSLYSNNNKKWWGAAECFSHYVEYCYNKCRCEMRIGFSIEIKNWV